MRMGRGRREVVAESCGEEKLYILSPLMPFPGTSRVLGTKQRWGEEGKGSRMVTIFLPRLTPFYYLWLPSPCSLIRF